MQLTLQDCLDMLDLTEEKVLAVAEHEHVPEVVAAGLATYLLSEPDGIPKLHHMIVEDIARADACGNHAHAVELRRVLRHFVEIHCRSGVRD